MALGLQLAVLGQLLAQLVGPPLPQQAIPVAMRSFAEVVAGPTPLDSADFVYVHHGSQVGPLADSYDGPYGWWKGGQR